jgi:hypothetical protein
MRNLCDDWARAIRLDFDADRPHWLADTINLRDSLTTEEKARPLLHFRGEEQARAHPRLAEGTVTVELHWHQNDGPIADAREILRLAMLELDTRRDTVALPDAVMTYYMPSPQEELVVEDGFIFRATRTLRFRATTSLVA